MLRALLDATGASRVTLRQDVPGDYAFPVTHEALGDWRGSLRGERTVDLPTQPVVLELQQGRQVVQDDCRAATTIRPSSGCSTPTVASRPRS